ncbi:Uncharacterised protein [Kluyvera intermedia]|nr:Uncharacterised protein [Kluyvera intermedia]
MSRARCAPGLPNVLIPYSNILVGGDTHSAINNLEILKAELLKQAAEERDNKTGQPKIPLGNLTLFALRVTPRPRTEILMH